MPGRSGRRRAASITKADAYEQANCCPKTCAVDLSDSFVSMPDGAYVGLEFSTMTSVALGEALIRSAYTHRFRSRSVPLVAVRFWKSGTVAAAAGSVDQLERRLDLDHMRAPISRSWAHRVGGAMRWSGPMRRSR